MKRSEINSAIKRAEGLIKSLNFALPPFASWTEADWKTKGAECDEIRDNALGWDVTDFCMGEFEKTGLTLFTVRNGNRGNPKYPKLYAEKIMVMTQGQLCPTHFHWSKTEDIINRGGGLLKMKLWNSLENEELDEASDVKVSVDGVLTTLPAGGELTLRAGESVTLTTGIYHTFWAEDGMTMIGEVSECNDDKADNRFLKPLPRFPKIEEDEAPYRLLCSEYVSG